MKRVLIAGGGTGGHLMPALAIAEALRERAPDVEPVLVGAARGVEARILPSRDFRFHLLPSEPIYRRTWWKNARWPLIAGRLLRQVAWVFAEERPAAVLGTGGYASGPVVWWAARQGLPSAVQEQNAYPGLATRLLSPRVRHVYLGLPEARSRLRFGARTEVFDTGNPIAPPTPARRAEALGRFGLEEARPVVLVTGGSQGALAINRAVAGWLDAGGPAGADLIWVTGRGTYEEFAARHRPTRHALPRKVNAQFDAPGLDLDHGLADQLTEPGLACLGLERRASGVMPVPGVGHAFDHVLTVVRHVHFDAAGNTQAARTRGRLVDTGQRVLQLDVVRTDDAPVDRTGEWKGGRRGLPQAISARRAGIAEDAHAAGPTWTTS